MASAKGKGGLTIAAGKLSRRPDHAATGKPASGKKANGTGKARMNPAGTALSNETVTHRAPHVT
jgi:hypothetical protein